MEDLREWALSSKGVLLPQPATLRKYGLTLPDYVAMLESQNWRCPICKRYPPAIKFVTDHEHFRGWKKMSPKQRRRYVRGLPCTHCNFRFLPMGLDSVKASRIATYLRRYEASRVDAWLNK